MKIELTQLELIKLVRQQYGIEAEIDLDVSLAADKIKLEPVVAMKPCVDEVVVPVKDDTSDFLEDVKKSKKLKNSKRKKKGAHTLPGLAVIDIPKKPKIDYSYYGVKIEEFLSSKEDFIVIPHEEDCKGSGLLYRYRTAAAMFGYRGAICLSCNKVTDVLIMSRPGKGPKNYTPAKPQGTKGLKAYIK